MNKNLNNVELYLNKYKSPDGDFIYGECHYEDAGSLLQCGILKHCGCGNPEANIRLVAKVLRHLSDWRMGVGDDDHEMSYDAWLKEGEKIAPREVLNFIYYTLDELELTEHGSAIPGWPTQLGIEFMVDAEALYGK